jgi:uncharacterized membrane protein YdfJ with MMPL/SSD domain
MMGAFAKLADSVIKHYKKYIAFWVVLLIVSLPFFMKIGEVTVYEETDAGGEEMTAESITAGQIIAKEFPYSGDNNSLIVVLQASDVRSPSVREYILNVENKMRSDPEIKLLRNFTSIYSVYRDVIEQSASEIAPVLYSTEANITSMSYMLAFVTNWGGINGTLMMVWGIPSSYAQAYDGVGGSAMMLHGIPSMYAQAYDGFSGSAMMMYGIPSMFMQAYDGIEGSALMMYGIPSMYSQAWDGVNGSAMMLYGIPDMFDQAWSGTNMTSFMLYGIPDMYQRSFYGNNQTAALLYGGPAGYMQAWLALSMLSDMKARNLEAFNQSWAAVNATITDEAQRQMMLGYHSVFHQYWDETFNASNASVYLDPLTVMPDDRANRAVNATAPPFFDFSVPANQTQQMMDGVMDSFNVTTFSNRTLVDQYTNNTTWNYLQAMMASMNVSSEQKQLLNGYYSAFTQGWSNSFLNASLDGTSSQERASYAIGQVASGYIAQVSAGNETMNMSMLGVLQAFNITNWMNETLFNTYTNATFSQMLVQMGGGFGLPPDMVQQLYLYYDAFYAGWNGTFLNSSLAGLTPEERASLAVSMVAPPFIAQSSAMDPNAGLMLDAVYRGFNLTNYADPVLVSTVANGTFSQTMQAMAGSFGLPPEQLQGLFYYYDMFYGAFNASFQNTSLAGIGTAARTKAAIDVAAPQFIAGSTAGNATLNAMMNGVYSTFNLTSWNDTALITSFTNTTFYSSMQSMAGSFGLPPEQLQGLWAYYDMFYGAFRASFQNSSLDGAPTANRTQSAIDATYPVFVNATASGNATMQYMLSKIYYTYNLSTWDNATFTSQLTFSSMKENIRQMGAQMGLSVEMRDSLMQYFNGFETAWYVTLDNSSLDGTSTLNRTKAAVDIAAPQYINATAGTNATMKAMLEGVLGAFNLTNWGNTTLISSFTNITLYSNLQAMTGSMGLPPEMAKGLMVYYDLFYSEWQASYSNASLANSTSMTRAAYAVDRAAPAFASSGRPEAAYAGAAYRYFNFTKYSDTANTTRYVSDAALTETKAAMSRYLANGNFGTSYSSTVRANLEMFSGLWNRTFLPNDVMYLPPSAALETRVTRAFENATSVIFAGTGGSGGGTAGGSFNMTKLADPAQARNLTLDLFLSGLGGAIKLDRAFAYNLTLLGPNPTKAQSRALAESIINSSDFEHYPVTLPSQITKNFVNEKHTTMIFMLGFASKSSGNKDMMYKNIDETRKVLSSGRSAAGVRTYVTGDLAIGGEMESSAFKDVEKIDPFTIAIVIILGVLFFASLVAPFVPFMGIGMAMLASQSILYFIGLFIAKIHYSVNILLFVILMGTGMDYCIFLLARYREERREGHPKVEAIRTSITWAGESIATSGVAVMIGFSGLAISEFAMLRTMGYILGIAIGIGILAALTFIPSILMIAGDKIFWPYKFKTPSDNSSKGADAKSKGKSVKDGRKAGKARNGDVFYFSRAVRFSLKHPVGVIAVCMLTFLPSFYLLFAMQPSFDFFEGMPKTEATDGFEVLGQSFGKGDLMPTQVVVQFHDPVYLTNGSFDTAALDTLDRLSRKLENVTVKDSAGKTMDIVNSATPGCYYLGERLDRIDWRIFGESTRNSTINSSLGKSCRTVVIKVVLNKEPFQKEALDAVPAMRDAIGDFKGHDSGLVGARVLVGGSSAGMYDIRLIIDSSMVMMRYVVVIGIFILLLIVLGSVLIPATAILSVGISISWTIAATMVIFQFIGGTHVLWMVPLILFVLLMGLGMDYNIFLITRVREEVAKGRTHHEAIQRAVERTGGIITICGMIMAGAFGSMMLSSLGLLQQFGFALFFSIVLDAFVVRIYLMPAILALAGGKASWYAPGKLQRVHIGKDGHGMDLKAGHMSKVKTKDAPVKEEE